MKKILDDVSKKIRPSEKEKEKALETFSEIRDFIKKKYKVEAKLVGSVGKSTFLKGDKNLDIFIFFPLKTSREKLEKKGLEIGKAVFKKYKGKYEIDYAEHPYTKGMINGFELDIVPAYKVKNTKQLKSAVDRTPFHLNYVKRNLEDSDQVRLLKKFLRGIGCYGSDLRNMGFSGYLCELLIINHNTFENVLKEAQNWRYQKIVDMKKAYSTKDYKKLKRNFKDQSFIFIDPTDKNRNVAAVLSREKYATFILNARKFLEKPSSNYFFPKEIKINKKKILDYLMKKKSKTIVIEFIKPEIIDDILYPQLRRLEKRIVKILKDNDFRVTDSLIYSNGKCGVAIELMYTELPAYKKISGPSVFNPPKHQDIFIKKYKKVWFEGDRFFAEVKRKYYKSEDFLKDYLRGSEKKLIEKGIPNHFAKIISKKFRIIKENEIRKIKEEEFWKGLEKVKIKL